MSAGEPKVLEFGHLRLAMQLRREWNSYTWHQTVVVLAGSLSLTFQGEVLKAGKGDVVQVPANVDFKIENTESQICELYFINWLGDGAHLPVVTVDQTGRIRTLLGWCMVDEGLDLMGQARLKEQYLSLFFKEYRKAVLLGEDELDLVHKVTNYITLNMHLPIGLDDLASVVGLSRSHFLRTFKKLRGHTPGEELRRQRIERARRLVMTTDLTLDAIAAQIGLANGYHLSRLFRQIHGVPPGAMRQAKNK